MKEMPGAIPLFLAPQQPLINLRIVPLEQLSLTRNLDSINSPSSETVVSSVQQNSEHQRGQKYVTNSLNSIRAPHSCENNMHRGFRSSTKTACYIHMFSP
jgi:hypothetical protein